MDFYYWKNFHDPILKNNLNAFLKNSRNVHKNIRLFFLGNRNCQTYEAIVGKTLSSFKALGYTIYLKLIFCTLTWTFRNVMGAVSYERRKKFYLDADEMKKSYCWKQNKIILVDWHFNARHQKRNTKWQIHEIKFFTIHFIHVFTEIMKKSFFLLLLSCIIICEYSIFLHLIL